MINSLPIEILLIDDNKNDILLIRETFKSYKISNNLHVLNNSLDTTAFLFKQDKYKDSLTPDLILMNWELPNLNGNDLLKKIKTDPFLKMIPVLILTSSQDDCDNLKAYNLHANACLTKPIDQNEFVSVIKSISQFWLKVVKLPTRAGWYEWN